MCGEGVERRQYGSSWTGESVAGSKLTLLAAQQASESETRCRGKEYDFTRKAGRRRRWQTSVSEKPSYRGLDASFFFKKINLFIYLFIYFWLCWVFVSVRGLSPVASSGGHSSSRCAGLSLSRPLPLRSTGSRRAGSVVVAHEPSCSAACGIFPDRGTNPCPLHWQADS